MMIFLIGKSKRGRERVLAHGPEFILMERTVRALASMPAGDKVLVRSDRTAWMGWLAIPDDVDVVMSHGGEG